MVKAALPDPSSPAPDYAGKTCIGNLVKGVRHGKPREVFIYNVADHAEAFAEVGSQAISYTAGVPAAAAAILVAKGDWDVRAIDVEELAPKPFLAPLDRMGLATRIRDGDGDRLMSFAAPAGRTRRSAEAPVPVA